MSHFTVLAAVQPDEKITAMLQAPDQGSNLPAVRAMHLYTMEQMMESLLEPLMEPYEECTENPDYLEFVNVEQECRAKYLTDTTLAVKMPDGRFICAYDAVFSRTYEIYDGKVYKKRFGQLHHRKRTKKAKRIVVLPECPVKKVYSTPEQYMEEYCGYTYHKKERAYGYVTNPNAKWDWYEIGGRWPFCFLVKEDCPSAVKGSRSWATKDVPAPPAPDGYCWVAGAMKRDIQWQIMKAQRVEQATCAFHRYAKWFKQGTIPHGNGPFLSITEEGISDWGSMAYLKGETLEQYLSRMGHSDKDEFSCDPFAYVSDLGWESSGDMGWFGCSSNNQDERVWQNMLQSFIAGLPMDAVLVSVDCHI